MPSSSLVLALTIGLPRREVLALRRPRSWPRSLGLALAALILIYVGAALALGLSGAGDEQNLTPEGWDSAPAPMRSASSRSSSSLRSRRSSCTAASACPCSWPDGDAEVGITAVLFGLGHGLVLSLAAFVWFGIVIALVRLRTEHLSRLERTAPSTRLNDRALFL